MSVGAVSLKKKGRTAPLTSVATMGGGGMTKDSRWTSATHRIVCKARTVIVMLKVPGVRPCAFSFQAEDGIRDSEVTGVQTCALPISSRDGIRDSEVTGVQTCALPIRSEEHTSELQSPQNLLCRLLLQI